MKIEALLHPLGVLDAAALAFLVLCWLVMTQIIENRRAARPSVSVLMVNYRRQWMRNAITRDPRVFDAMLMTSLRDNTAFFASACMIAIGGGIALIGNAERLTGLARDLSIDGTTRALLEIKLIVVVLFVTNAFLKFVWSNRIFGYCSVVLGSIPNTGEDDDTLHRAAQAAELNIAAARAFNRGLRSVYFSLGSLVWLLGALPLIGATLLTVLVLWRREFASHSRAVLQSDVPEIAEWRGK